MPTIEPMRRPEARRLLTHAVLMIAIAALAGSPGSLSAQPAPGRPEPVAAAKKAAPDFPPFDLSYMPARATSLLALRPAAILAREDMKPHVKAIRESLSMLLGRWDIRIPIRPESIEQLTLAQRRPPRGRGNDRHDDPDLGFCLGLRMAEDTDVTSALKQMAAALEMADGLWAKAIFEGKEYHRLPSPPDGPKKDQPSPLCVYFPAPRTIVVADEETLREVLRQPARDRPNLASGGAWEDISRGLVACASAVDGPDDEVDDFSQIALEFFCGDVIPAKPKHSRLIHAGIDRDETLRFRVSDDYGDAKSAAAEALARIGRIVEVRAFTMVASGEEEKADPVVSLMMRRMNDLMRSSQVRANGPTVEIEARCHLAISEVVKVFSCDPSAAPVKLEKEKQAAAKPAQRETR